MVDQLPVFGFLSTSDDLCCAVIRNLWDIEPDDYVSWMATQIPDSDFVAVLISTPLLVASLFAEQFGQPDPTETTFRVGDIKPEDITVSTVHHAARLALHNPVTQDQVVFCCGLDDLMFLDLANQVDDCVAFVSACVLPDDITVEQVHENPEMVLASIADRQWLSDDLIEEETQHLMLHSADPEFDQFIVICPIHTVTPHDGPVTIQIPVTGTLTPAFHRVVASTVRLAGFCGGVIFGWDDTDDDYSGDAWVFTPGGIVAVGLAEASAAADTYVE